MHLTKQDYANILKLLDTVEIKGKESAKYIAVLAHKLETRVANWVDGDPSGVKPEAQLPLPLEPPPGD